jgi:hypothetical protein
MDLNIWGLVIGACSLLAIGLGHVWVIRGEYHFGVKIWPIPLALGLALCAGSLFFESVVVSAVLAVNGMALLWGIRELFQQRERVRKGWFPKKSGAK